MSALESNVLARSESEVLVGDVVARALAALRERNLLPSVDLPPVTLVPLEGAQGERGYLTRIAIEVAQAAEAQDIEHRPAEALAANIARYLAETVDLVPAYSAIARVEPDDAAVIHIYLRDE
jgi:hypothetical protein